MTSCSEWTGVPLSLLLKEVGVQKGASWVVSEGSEEVMGAGSIRLAKAMDDCLVCYGQNGEAIRPQQGFPVRLVVPGFEGIYNTKWLRRIKVVDRYYMTYNDYGHISDDPESRRDELPVGTEIGHHLSFGRTATARSGKLPDHWPGLVRRGRRSQGGSIHRRRPDLERRSDSRRGKSDGAHPVWHELEMGKTGVCAPVALHR